MVEEKNTSDIFVSFSIIIWGKDFDYKSVALPAELIRPYFQELRRDTRVEVCFLKLILLYSLLKTGISRPYVKRKL